MKVLIWIGTLLGVVILNTILGAVLGFRLGALPIGLIVSGIATALCKKRDERIENQTYDNN